MVVKMSLLESMASHPFVSHVSGAWSEDRRIVLRMIPVGRGDSEQPIWRGESLDHCRYR